MRQLLSGYAGTVPLMRRPFNTSHLFPGGAASAAQGAELDSDMPLLEHAFQTAEACRLAHPDQEWLHLVRL